jgi:hypothetical protein
VTCNTRGNVIALYFFENSLDGYLPDSLVNLVHLRHLTIANDGREHEGEVNPNRNTIYLWNSKVISQLTNLEEINMQNLNMTGVVGDSLLNLVNLKYLNLGYNILFGTLPDVIGWSNLQKLEFIEIMQNDFTGPIPSAWSQLPNL